MVDWKRCSSSPGSSYTGNYRRDGLRCSPGHWSAISSPITMFPPFAGSRDAISQAPKKQSPSRVTHRPTSKREHYFGARPGGQAALFGVFTSGRICGETVAAWSGAVSCRGQDHSRVTAAQKRNMLWSCARQALPAGHLLSSAGPGRSQRVPSAKTGMERVLGHFAHRHDLQRNSPVI